MEQRRSYGINEQRQRDISQSPFPSHLFLCTHTPPLLLCAFVSLSSPLPLKLCCLYFISLWSFSPCLPSFLQQIPQMLSWCPWFLPCSSLLLQLRQRSIRQLCSGWHARRSGAVPRLRASASPAFFLIHESSADLVDVPVICSWSGIIYHLSWLNDPKFSFGGSFITVQFQFLMTPINLNAMC